MTDNFSALPEPPELPPGTIRTDSKGIKQVWVPPGRFLMGSDQTRDKDALPNEQPPHEVRISRGFWLDMYPVTNAAYEQFIADGGYKKRALWSAVGWKWIVEELKYTRANDSEGFTDPQQPRVGISWYEADAYARWRGGRLATEAEWEYAARGPQSLIYPWGNTWDKNKANTFDGGPGVTTSVGSYENGISWCGADDLVGNTWEWIADWYDENYYQQQMTDDPQGPASGHLRGHRGGSWDAYPGWARGACRGWYDPAFRFDYLGARVASAPS